MLNRVLVNSASEFRLGVVPLQDAGADLPRSLLTHAAEVRGRRAGLRVVVSVDLETYVAGVLAGEAATLKSPPALAAMAVVARTWALRARGRHRIEGFDFCSLTHCQFFRPPLGMADESSTIPKALRDSAGLVLKYHGELIDAYYSANCGGVTASARDVWPDRGEPYLESVRDPYCERDGQTSWTQTIHWTDLQNVLAKYRVAAPRDLIVDARDRSGRARTLRLVGERAQRIDANELRYALNRKLGWNTLKSSLYDVERQGNALIFTGRGLGHGVGLCQAGAEQMGKLGMGYERILAHYFPGTKLEKVENGCPARVLASEHFELFFPESEEGLAAKALEILEGHRGRLGEHTQTLPVRIPVRTFQTTGEFIGATGQPGWVSGTNDGQAIDLQPLSILQRRGNLSSTLHHELLHLVIRRLRAPTVPRWYEEGLVLYLTGERLGNLPADAPADTPSEGSFTRPRSADEMRIAYAWARQRVTELARRRGDAALWRMLRNPSEDDLRWLKNQL